MRGQRAKQRDRDGEREAEGDRQRGAGEQWCRVRLIWILIHCVPEGEVGDNLPPENGISIWGRGQIELRCSYNMPLAPPSLAHTHRHTHRHTQAADTCRTYRGVRSRMNSHVPLYTEGKDAQTHTRIRSRANRRENTRLHTLTHVQEEIIMCNIHTKHTHTHTHTPLLPSK